MGLVVCIDLISPHGEARAVGAEPFTLLALYNSLQRVTKATRGDRASKITTATNIGTV